MTLTKEKSNRLQELHRFTAKIYKNEEIKLRQRAHHKWLKEGDANTVFFYRIANMRRTNSIHVLESSKGPISSAMGIQQHVHSHFKRLFWSESLKRLSLDSDFTEEEVKDAVWQLGSEKAPGPDDFPLFFYQTFWKDLKDDVMALLKKFAKEEVNLERINYSFIVLITKKETPQTISDYSFVE